jgi:hypothetical protein
MTMRAMPEAAQCAADTRNTKHQKERVADHTGAERAPETVDRGVEKTEAARIAARQLQGAADRQLHLDPCGNGHVIALKEGPSLRGAQ